MWVNTVLIQTTDLKNFLDDEMIDTGYDVSSENEEEEEVEDVEEGGDMMINQKYTTESTETKLTGIYDKFSEGESIDDLDLFKNSGK